MVLYWSPMTVRGLIKTAFRPLRFTAWLLASFAVAGFSPGITEPATAALPTTDDRPRIVAFGNSLTAGLGVAAEDSYPSQLQRRLDQDGFQSVSYTHLTLPTSD